MNTFTLSLITIVALICIWFVSVYNKLIHSIEAVINNKNQIDVQLDRRFKVYESLIEVVKKYMDYEQTTLKEVVTLRNQSQQALASGNEKARMSAEDAISKIGTNLNMVFEQYPELKANQNALQLQEEIVGTENKLTFAKQAYNDSIEKYNVIRKSLLESMVVSVAPKLYREFDYWNISDTDRVKQENYTVKL